MGARIAGHGRRTTAHVAEPQQIFVPVLVDIFLEAGLFVEHVAAQIDPRLLIDDQPDLVFLDVDYIDQPMESVRVARLLVPRTQIFIFAVAPSDAISRAFTAAGANVVLEKSLDRQRVVQAIHVVDRLKRHRQD
ncbi:MAG: hypothetical protein ABI282_09455 [Candidatus Baltobacteraceae bacterium]